MSVVYWKARAPIPDLKMTAGYVGLAWAMAAFSRLWQRTLVESRNRKRVNSGPACFARARCQEPGRYSAGCARVEGCAGYQIQTTSSRGCPGAGANGSIRVLSTHDVPTRPTAKGPVGRGSSSAKL